MSTYPDCPFITRKIEIGGLTKSKLIEKLKQSNIFTNEYANILLYDEKFTTSDTKYSIQIVDLSVGGLGFPDGATLPQIFNRAGELGLGLCSLEVGPYLRLEYLDQPEGYVGKPIYQHQAPTGSITIASELVSEDDDFPKGFYLRKIKNELWLRGYIADNLHVWNPDDHFVFVKQKNS